jgi:hypothetical protein
MGAAWLRSLMLLAALIGAIAVASAGCGGGGNGTPTDTNTPSQATAKAGGQPSGGRAGSPKHAGDHQPRDTGGAKRRNGAPGGEAPGGAAQGGKARVGGDQANQTPTGPHPGCASQPAPSKAEREKLQAAGIAGEPSADCAEQRRQAKADRKKLEAAGVTNASEPPSSPTK